MPHSSYMMSVSEFISDIEIFKKELFMISDALGPSGEQGNEGYNLEKAFEAV